MDYQNFKTTGVFTSNDKFNILDAIGNVFKNEYTWICLQNELYGLFDGYYYIGLEQRVFDSEYLSKDDKLSILGILLKVKSQLQQSK